MKRYTLRWLFYRTPRLNQLIDPSWESSTRCSNCKKGVTNYLVIFDCNDVSKLKSICPNCKEALIQEPNTNISRYLLILLSWFANAIHLVRKKGYARYDMFGDEANYVKKWEVDIKTTSCFPVLYKRKWWNYVIIKNKQHEKQKTHNKFKRH